MLPSFFVVGAQKSGTTSLCSILDAHPSILISDPKEPFFFDRDDYVAHPMFFAECKREWKCFDWERKKHKLLEQYERIFGGAQEGIVCGEGSTTYMASTKAPTRIAEVIPHAKIIFALRDPVDRAYSAYWHLVMARQAIYSFEDQIKFEPLSILQRGLYKEQIDRFLDHFPRDQLHFVIFEVYIRNTRQEAKKAYEFLEVDTGIDFSKAKIRRNPARVPRWIGMHLTLNAAARLMGMKLLSHNFRGLVGEDHYISEKIVLSCLKRLQTWNLKIGRYPDMSAETRNHLEEFYRRENRGLSDLIGVDLASYWKCAS